MFDVQLKMDRFVTRKRKPGEIGEGESSGAIASEKRSVTNTQQFEEQEKQKSKSKISCGMGRPVFCFGIQRYSYLPDM